MVSVTTSIPQQPGAEALSQAVARCLGEAPQALLKQPGGLSPRQFFRMRRETGQAAMVMWLPEDAPERVLARRLGRRLPFLEIRELLEGAGVRVPALYGALPDEGVLVVEDLGETLAERLERAPGERDALYRRAVLDLAAAQRALAVLPEGSVIETRSFDRELLAWELAHFREWGIEALGASLSAEAASSFEAASRYLVETIARMDYGFVHRDYQSRNLLALPDGNLAWIDFQDALLGPRAYDLVALLCDSYQSFERDFVEQRLADYAEARGVSDLATLRFEHDVITVQRKLKDAGRFVFFDRTRGDPSYLRYYVPTLELVRGALSRLPRTPDLLGLAGLVTRQIEIGQSRGMLRA